MSLPESSPDARAPASLWREPEEFLVYLAERLQIEKSFRVGVPVEARGLAENSEVALTLGELSLTFCCLLKIEQGTLRFALSREEVTQLGMDCLKYSGSMNGAKMPVSVLLLVVGRGELGDAARARLEELQRRSPGLSKVAIHWYYLDLEAKSVESPSLGARWFPRSGFAGFLRRLLENPRLAPEEGIAPSALLPSNPGRPWLTGASFVVLGAFFVIEQLKAVHRMGLLGVDAASLFALGAMNGEAVRVEHEWYRLFTAALYHGDLLHLVFNGVGLGLAGFLLEPLIGSAWFFVLFVLGALGGSVAGLLLNSPEVVSIGASGAVMGLLAAGLVLSRRFPAGPERMLLRVRLAQFLIPSLIPLATIRGEQVDYAAHFGGALTGALLGAVVLATWPKDRERPRGLALVRLLGFVLLLGATASVASARAAFPKHYEEASFSPGDYLVPPKELPSDPEVAKRDVEIWGKNYPRDPRVHYFRAHRLLDERDLEGAAAELELALGETKILERAFSDGRFEAALRHLLAAILFDQGKLVEAREVAAPACARGLEQDPDLCGSR